ncbi:MAG: hypothetical protein WA951_04030, partial [Leeuwenhoekiella sp.]
ENVGAIDYAYLLNFMEASQQASPEITIAQIIASDDVIDLDLQLVDTYIKSTLLDEQLSFATYKNFSFDFSTGFFYNTLVEPEYYLVQDVDDDNGLRIQEEDKSNSDISIGALGHFTYKFLPEWRGGMALGIAISPLDGKLRYLLGPTIIWGGQKQVSLTMGLALAQMDELSGAVRREDEGVYLPEGYASIPTRNTLKSGFFIGISYNLTNRKQQ